MIYETNEDSFFLSKQVKKYAKNKKVLDIGTGSGIQAETAKEAGAKSVLATDIDKKSIDFSKEKGLNIIKSDLFEKINGKFDLIIFNPPYLPLDEREDNESRKATTGGKNGDEIILRFIKKLPKHLNLNGSALILLSSFTPRKRILQELEKLKLKKKIVASQNLFMEKLEVWEIKKKFRQENKDSIKITASESNREICLF